MTRALIELLIIIIFVIGARSVLTSVMRGLSGGAGNRSAANPPPPSVPAGGELHKDPICGTYVAGSTRFQRQLGSQTFYYCSAECRERHGVRMAKAG
jgi:YHS domain-containing protein